MRTGSLRWIAPVVLGCVVNLAVRPAFAQTPPPAAAPAPGPAPQPYAYPPPPPGAYPPGYPPPGYPPPYAPAPYPPYTAYPPPQPPGPPQMVHRPWRGFLVGGIVTFSVSWGLALVFSSFARDYATNDCGGFSTSCASDRAMGRYFWIPVVGPVVAEASTPGGGINWTWATLWSLAEAGGVVMTIVGIAGHDVPEYGYGRRRAMLDLVPMLSPTSQGLGLRARF